MTEIVSLKNVSVNFGTVRVLSNINLSIQQNDFLAVIGPNGGGKTTLLKLLLGLVEPEEGEVKIFGKDPVEGRISIGYLPQYTFFDLSFPINVFDVVLMGRYERALKRYSKSDAEATTEALKGVGMLEFKDRQIGQLSGGQMQRIFVARAIVRNPKLLLLDEPTASIDTRMQRSFYEILLELNKSMAIIMATHDIGAVSTYVKEIACLNKRLFYHGSKEEGLKNPEVLYNCPVDLIAHGAPHRVFKEHEK